MTDYIPPEYSQVDRIISDAADNISRARRRSGGLLRRLPGRQKELGEAYMKESRTLYLHCRSLMEAIDQDNAQAAYNVARDKRENMYTGRVSIRRTFRDAKEFKGLSKEAYLTTKKASDRALDNNILGPLGRTDPPAGAPPATPEEPDGTDPPDGAPPATPEEPDAPPPHNPCIDPHAALSPGAAGIGGPMDEVHETSFTYDLGLASSETSIASYKTERTVNSRKSRQNALPRRKHADSGHLGVTGGIASLNVGDVSVQGSEVPTARPPPEPSSPDPDQWMTDRPQEADSTSHISSEGLAGADD
ncbi:hypothetical protein EDB85DRAFT_1041667 [Lactarius pseudohatsudake]|nr:hypothetical protein EDB85DRAFT_1041667 [Lactarius pseudohatsudake]